MPGFTHVKILMLASSQIGVRCSPALVMRRVALMLAVPRPLQLERILPIVASLGVTTLVLCQAKKVGYTLRVQKCVGD